MRFRTVSDIRCEDGISHRLGRLVGEHYGPCLIFMVTDPGIIKAGLVAPVVASLEAAGHRVTVFSGVSPDPTEAQVKQGHQLARAAGLVVGLGGGSAMDVAKLVACLVSSGVALDSCYGVDQITPQASARSRANAEPRANARSQTSTGRLPLIQIPTTAGTGSEVTNISIITTGETTKKGIVDPILYADIALLDASLTLTLPRHQTAATAIDAMVHAIEAYTSKRLKNIQSDALAVQALRMIGASLPRVIARPDDLAARRHMLLGACLAGQAFANAPVAAVHALAYPVGGHFHVSHGLSNSLLLPHVLRFNIRSGGAGVAALYHELAQALGLDGGADALLRWIESLVADTGIEQRLRDVGIGEADLPTLVGDAMKQERLLINNPVAVLPSDAAAIYEAAW